LLARQDQGLRFGGGKHWLEPRFARIRPTLTGQNTTPILARCGYDSYACMHPNPNPNPNPNPYPKTLRIDDANA
jgi:hypothetical protein